MKRTFSYILFLIMVTVSCNNTTYDRIKKEVDNIWLVDTHEHLITEKGRMQFTTDFFYFIKSYFRHDMKSSGMSDKEEDFIFDESKPLEERWAIFSPYWERAKNTGYAQCIRITAKGLFGVDDINENTYKILNKKLLATNNGGWYHYVLKEKSRIDVSIVTPLRRYTRLDDDYSNEYFLKVKVFDSFINPDKSTVKMAKEQAIIEIHSLEDYLTAVDIIIKQAVNIEGIAGFKCALAYRRSLYFEKVSMEEAQKVFEKAVVLSQDINSDESKKFQDFMMHHILKQASLHNMPVQIHTGMLAGNWESSTIDNVNARLLSNLFLEHRNVKFVIFHGSYPYMAELSYLAKNYPNVYIDMCWMHIISPSSSKRYLEEWLCTVPVNKIMAFGGDMGSTVELVYGHSVMARGIVAEVLTKMVKEGYFSEEEAVSVAKKVLRENALELYSIKKEGDHFYSERMISSGI